MDVRHSIAGFVLFLCVEWSSMQANFKLSVVDKLSLSFCKNKYPRGIFEVLYGNILQSRDTETLC